MFPDSGQIRCGENIIVEVFEQRCSELPQGLISSIKPRQTILCTKLSIHLINFGKKKISFTVI